MNAQVAKIAVTIFSHTNLVVTQTENSIFIYIVDLFNKSKI